MNADRWVDEIACEMTSGEPSPEFRARVLDRLGVRPPLRWPWLAAPAAGVALAAALAIWLPRSSDVHRPAPLASVSADSPDASSARVAQPPTPSIPARTLGRAGNRYVSSDELAWRARAVPPLPDIPALTLQAIQPWDLSIAPIAVEPLVTDPIEIAAITSRSGTCP